MLYQQYQRLLRFFFYLLVSNVSPRKQLPCCGAYSSNMFKNCTRLVRVLSCFRKHCSAHYMYSYSPLVHVIRLWGQICIFVCVMNVRTKTAPPSHHDQCKCLKFACRCAVFSKCTGCAYIYVCMYMCVTGYTVT